MTLHDVINKYHWKPELETEFSVTITIYQIQFGENDMDVIVTMLGKLQLLLHSEWLFRKLSFI